MEDTEKYCVNCAFYVPHYIIMSERLCMTSGHCKNTLRTRKKILYPEETCAEWRAKPSRIEERESRARSQGWKDSCAI